MAKYYGPIGFAIDVEEKPGIFVEKYVERYYKGDILKRSRQWEPTDHLNDHLVISNDISIVADSFAQSNFGVMRYLRINDQPYEITSATIDTERHRITLSLGGVFNVPNGD